jgi:folylpolyglutamate synthase/dihydropteroate synthase
MQDKDYATMLDALLPATQVLVAVEPKIARALRAKDILREAKRRGMNAMEGPETWRGLEKAVRLASRTPWPILVIGSNYVAGEILHKYHS